MSPVVAVVVVRVATTAVNTIELTIAKAKGGGQATTGKPAERGQPLLYSGLVGERFVKIGLAPSAVESPFSL